MKTKSEIKDKNNQKEIDDNDDQTLNINQKIKIGNEG